ncbi:MAG: hypothetical protein LBG44_09820 [Gemmatimonadota bacterium]|nr:hypothetical protein [Gemmatimonadota bacterium]
MIRYSGKGRGLAVLMACLAAVTCATSVGAQEWTGEVLQRGAARITLGGDYAGFRSLRGENGPVPLGAGLGGPLTPETFLPLASFAGLMDAFLAATGAPPFPLSEDDFSAGDLSGRLAVNNRVGTIRIGVGVFPRVEVGVATSIARTERLPIRIDLSGGALGLNPDQTLNADLLSQVSAADGAQLGGSTLLPVASSRLGIHLQNLVVAATGDSLVLPEAAVTVQQLAGAFGFAPFAHEISPIGGGDLEFDARVELLKTFADPYYPAPSSSRSLNARVTARGVVRLPTGASLLQSPGKEWSPLVGHSGIGVGAAADLFAGQRFQLSATADWLRPGANRISVLVPLNAITGTETGIAEADYKPGSILRFVMVPKLRLSREISMGGSYQMEGRSAGSWTIEGAQLPIGKRSAHAAGFMIGYSSLPGYQNNPNRTPVEASIGFTRVFAGSGGAPDARFATVRVSIFRKFSGVRTD